MRWTLTEKTGELVITGILFGIGLYWILGSRTMPSGEFSVPGPGFFPMLIGILLCAISLALGVQVLPSKRNQPVNIGHPRIWLTILALNITGLIFNGLGFILAIAIFLGFLLKLFSRLRLFICLLLAILAAFAAFGFFDLLLGIQLPKGQWF